MEKDDDILVTKVRKGDQDSFAELVHKYSNLVGSIAYNIIGDVQIAHDISQETFLKVFRNIESLDDTRKFKGWLCSIVRTTCVDWMRKEKIKALSIDKLTEDGKDPEGRFVSGIIRETTTEAEELREKILCTINALPKIYQEIILLRHLRKMSYREIGSFLNLPMATIESRLYRARLMLKDKLMDLYM